MLIFNNLRPYFRERFLLVTLLWGSIAAVTWFASHISKFVDEKSNVSILPSLFAYADWRLVVLLAVGAVFGAGVTSFILSRVLWNPADAIRQLETTARLWDEVSSAATHLAMAYSRRCFLMALETTNGLNFYWSRFMCFSGGSSLKGSSRNHRQPGRLRWRLRRPHQCPCLLSKVDRLSREMFELLV